MISKSRRSILMRRGSAAALLLTSLAMAPVEAQFKAVGRAPYSAAIARQKIRALLAKIDPANQQQTIATISDLLVWFRDVADDELIAAWKRDAGRDNLLEAMTALADGRVAIAVVEFSWRERREATFQLAYAPMFANLMLRVPDSAKPFIDDLVAAAEGTNGQRALNLTEAEQYTVCRILIDMPDVGPWNKTALQILSLYSEVAQTLVMADLNQGSVEKRSRAQYWAAALKPNPAGLGGRQSQRPNPAPSLSTRADTATEGTLECTGGPIPNNGEYVFYNVPTANRRFEYDRKIWDVRLEPGQAETRNFILKNKSSKPQKSCIVRWTIVP